MRTNVRINNAKRSLARAWEHYQRKRSQLVDRHGRAIYAPDEQARRLQVLDDELSEAVAAAEQVIETERTRITGERAALSMPVIYSLDGADIARASALQDVIDRDLNSRGVSDLRTFVDGLLASGDRVVAAAVQHVIEQRLRASELAGVGGQLSDDERVRRDALLRVRERVDGALSMPADDTRREQIEGDQQQLAELDELVKQATGTDVESRANRYIEQGEAFLGIRVRR